MREHRCRCEALDAGFIFAGAMQVVGAAMFGAGLVPHEVKVQHVLFAPTLSFEHAAAQVGIRATF